MDVIKNMQAGWQNMSTGKKAASVATAAVAATAVGLTTAAAVRGGKIAKVNAYELVEDKFVKKATEEGTKTKFADKLKEGFASIFNKASRENYKENKVAQTAKDITTQIKADKFAANVPQNPPQQ